MKIPTVQEIYDLVKKGLTIEEQTIIMDLRLSALELQEENIELKERIRTLEQKLEIKEKLVFKDKQYWLKSEGKDELDGPFCQRCWDVDTKLVRTQKAFGISTRNIKNGNGNFCNQCKSLYAFRG